MLKLAILKMCISLFKHISYKVVHTKMEMYNNNIEINTL